MTDNNRGDKISNEEEYKDKAGNFEHNMVDDICYDLTCVIMM